MLQGGGIVIDKVRFSERFSGRQRDERVPVLAYHFTGEPADAEDGPYTLSTDLFDREMRFLVESGYRDIKLDQLVDAIEGRLPWPERGVVISFDDGRACVYRHAFQVLKRYRLGATVFLISSRLTNPAFLSVDQIREMEDHGIEFQSHGHGHRNFATLSSEEIEFDVIESKRRLDAILSRKVTYFAYPFGGLNPVAREVLAANGYRGAVCSRTGCAGPSSQAFELPRLGMRGSDTIEAFARKLDIGRSKSAFELAKAKVASAIGRLRH